MLTKIQTCDQKNSDEFKLNILYIQLKRKPLYWTYMGSKLFVYILIYKKKKSKYMYTWTKIYLARVILFRLSKEKEKKKFMAIFISIY